MRQLILLVVWLCGLITGMLLMAPEPPDILDCIEEEYCPPLDRIAKRIVQT